MKEKSSYRPTDLALWLGIFFYVLVTGLLIQLVILPYIFPSWNAGDGLLIGLDTNYFNQSALDLLDKIKTTGWQNWSLKYDGDVVVGIAVLFYALINPHPWSMLPLNGILNATAGLAIFHILLFFIKDRRKAFFATLPFILFPTALSWTAQYHNDNYMVTGVALVLLGWIHLSNLDVNTTLKRILLIWFQIFIGCTLIWLVRSYVLKSMLVFILLITLILIIFLSIKKLKKLITLKQFLITVILILFSFGIHFFLVTVKFIDHGNRLAINSQVTRTLTPEQKAKNEIRSYYERKRNPWEKIAWMPIQIDDIFFELIKTRNSAYRAKSGSNIDEFVQFTNAIDVIKYVPRAIEIGFLAPFPYQWFESGTKSPNTALRKVTGFEMMFIYFSWIGLIYSIWHWRKNLTLWVLLILCAGMITVYPIAVINAGTLHRFTFSYTMPLVGLGVAGWFEIFRVLLPKFSEIRSGIK